MKHAPVFKMYISHQKSWKMAESQIFLQEHQSKQIQFNDAFEINLGVYSESQS